MHRFWHPGRFAMQMSHTSSSNLENLESIRESLCEKYHCTKLRHETTHTLQQVFFDRTKHQALQRSIVLLSLPTLLCYLNDCQEKGQRKEMKARDVLLGIWVGYVGICSGISTLLCWAGYQQSHNT